MHGVARNIAWSATTERSGALFALGFDYLFAAVEAGGRDMVAQVRLTRSRLNGERWIGQKVMGAMHAALGRGLLILLNSHFRYSFSRTRFFESG
jgi:hypothetical protein